MANILISLGWLVAGGVLYHLLLPFLGEYGKRKAQNLADKHDVKQLTALIEGVKHDYQMVLEQLKGRNQLRLAAVDRRLQAHQDAFRLWRKLARKLYSEELTGVLLECQEWWEANCLFLSAEARSAFHAAMWAAHGHEDFVSWAREARSDDAMRQVRENRDVLTRAGEVIVQGADLPSLGERESQDVTTKTESLVER